MITISKIWKRPLVEPLMQTRLEFQSHDSKKSANCPIYTEACKSSVYLCLTDDLEVHWHGGKEYTVKHPDWWIDTWNEAKRDWYLGAGSKSSGKTRYNGDSPFASKRGGSMLHAGGITMNFFTGLTIKTNPGVKTLVTRPTNLYSSVWTVQDGIYDSDDFTGDFSFNIQVLRTEPFLIRAGEPVVSLFETNTSPSFAFLDRQPEEDAEAASNFYVGKSSGKRYSQLLSNSQAHSQQSPEQFGSACPAGNHQKY